MPESPKQRAVTVAVLGTGSIGARHMEVFHESGAEVIAVPLRKSRVAELCEAGWLCAESLAEAEHRGANAVIIATDTGRHARDIEDAFNLGLNVLVEKPMAPSATDASRLPRLAGEKGLVFFVGCCLRFDPGLNHIKSRLGDLGDIHSVRIECGSFLPEWRPDRDYRQSYSARAEEGGVLRDLIHEMDYALWLFGLPQWIFGTLSNFSQLGVESEELADALWVTPSGCMVSISLDYLTRRPRRCLYISGSKGSFEYCLLSRRLVVNMAGQDAKEIGFDRRPNDVYLDQAGEFLRAVSGHAPKRLATGEDGLRALGVCDAWRQSSVSGSRELPSIS